MANAAVAAGILLTGVAVLLFAVGTLSYLRLRHGRLAWVAASFLGFAVEGGLLTSQAYLHRGAIDSGPLLQSALILPVLNLAIVLAMYAAVLKR